LFFKKANGISRRLPRVLKLDWSAASLQSSKEVKSFVPFFRCRLFSKIGVLPGSVSFYDNVKIGSVRRRSAAAVKARQTHKFRGWHELCLDDSFDVVQGSGH
jgi:hypothetical protein